MAVSGSVGAVFDGVNCRVHYLELTQLGRRALDSSETAREL